MEKPSEILLKHAQNKLKEMGASDTVIRSLERGISDTVRPESKSKPAETSSELPVHQRLPKQFKGNSGTLV